MIDLRTDDEWATAQDRLSEHPAVEMTWIRGDARRELVCECSAGLSRVPPGVLRAAGQVDLGIADVEWTGEALTVRFE